MFQSIGRGQTSGATTPLVKCFSVGAEGWLVDAVETSVTLFDPSDNPVPSPIGPSPVGERVSTGMYAMGWTVPTDIDPGIYRLRWAFRAPAILRRGSVLWPSIWQYSDQLLEIADVAELTPSPAYLTVAELREAGISSAALSDARARQLIRRASQFIERSCNYEFGARYESWQLDGINRTVLEIPQPIQAIERILLTEEMVEVPSENVVVYRREQDVGFPRIAMRRWVDRDLYGTQIPVSVGSWPLGAQTILVSGIFGYTEQGGSLFGDVPGDIKRAITLMVSRDIASLTDQSRATQGIAIQSESVRDQSVSYSIPESLKKGPTALTTGYPDVDAILSAYRRPRLTLGAA